MRTRLAIALGLVLSAGSAAFAQARPPAPPTLLASNGLRNGGPETVLPAGAVVHIRAHNLANLIDTLEELIVSFVPDKALPPPLRALLDQKNPVLAFVGMQTIRQPLNTAVISQLLGVALDRPLSLTFYPREFPNGFVLAVPMKQPAALTNLLMNLLRPRRFEKVTLPGGSAYRVVGTNPDLPRSLFIVCSDDTAYVCGSRTMATRLLVAEPGKRLSDSAMIGRSIREYGREDLTITADTTFLKDLLPMLMQFQQFPPDRIAELRRRALRGIPPRQRVRFEMRLRWRFGIRDIDQLFDYAECVATSAYETVFTELVRQIRAFDGLTLSIDVGKKFHRMSFAAYSKEIRPEDFTQPIPAGTAETAIGRLPGPRTSISLVGRSPAPGKSEHYAAWLKLLKAKMRQKELPLNFVDLLIKHADSIQSPAPLESKVPWRASASSLIDLPPSIEGIRSLGSYAKLLGKQMEQGPASTLTVLPRETDDLFEKHFAAEVKANNATESAYREFEKKGFDNEGFYRKVSRFRVESVPGIWMWPLKGPLKRYIREEAYITRHGLFGYSQHEFINRRIYLGRTVGDYLYLQQEGAGNDWLRQADEKKLTPPPEAVKKLLAQAPNQVNTVVIVRTLHLLLDLATVLTQFEDVAHAEIDAYLAQAKKVLDANPRGRKTVEGKLLDLPVPIPVMTLNRDNKAKLYCVLVGNLHYPRPKVMPLVNDLLKEFAARADQIGGSAQFVRVLPGKYEASAVQSTEALAFLVKTAVNRFFELHMADPAGLTRLQQSVLTPRDGQLRISEALVTNPLWEFLLEGQFGGGLFGGQAPTIF